ncbi:hypothetical protein LOTGIDRAFT_172306 [Lottia gigantea]|uniref:O-acyltransferase n=1 Tax=Lottia gigantea TaxID=225164 RepID=V4AWR7_LOTGI|nr:hypothetical protein LOTGIDRAFT_172306 [Lottia gigantea]ESP01933.1 hypothetical protein LOTGIDRAFT_172306 [Lottia gigantea]
MPPLPPPPLPPPPHKKRKNGELPDKIFVNRRSVLSELFEVNHIRTIYHIFVAILIVFSLNTFIHDWIHTGRPVLDFALIQWNFGQFPKVIALWLCMKGSTTVIVYPVFYHWANSRTPGKARLWDYLWLGVYIIYMISFTILPLTYLFEYKFPPTSSIIITCEQLRLMMKTHAFVRSNIPRILNFKKEDETENGFPDFSKYLYFLFAPTLVYQDSYPRTPSISWKYVVSNFAQVLACMFYIYYIFERFCVPVFQNFNQDHVTLKGFMLSVFGCMLPGTLVLFIGFFAILHSWLNAFAEMLSFGDRLFYKDWWNSTTFSNYYRTWNVVVHDWLYTYVYKDVYYLIGGRAVSMAMVFLLSAVFHEYILIATFGFFFPVLFVMFAGAGFRGLNVFMWVALFIGTGLLMCLYSMEWYARYNCPVSTDNFLDYLIPRSWFCDFSGLELKS